MRVRSYNVKMENLTVDQCNRWCHWTCIGRPSYICIQNQTTSSPTHSHIKQPLKLGSLSDGDSCKTQLLDILKLQAGTPIWSKENYPWDQPEERRAHPSKSTLGFLWPRDHVGAVDKTSSSLHHVLQIKPNKQVHASKLLKTAQFADQWIFFRSSRSLKLEYVDTKGQVRTNLERMYRPHRQSSVSTRNLFRSIKGSFSAFPLSTQNFLSTVFS